MPIYKKYENEFSELIKNLGFTIKTTDFYLGDCLQNENYPDLYIGQLSFIYKYNKTHYIVTLYNATTDVTFKVEATNWAIFTSEIKDKLNLYFTKS